MKNYSRIDILLSSDEFFFIFFSSKRERKNKNKGRWERRRYMEREWRMMVTGIWNNTVLIQRPRSAPYIGGKGRSHATEHNWFHSVNLLEQRKYLVLFISYERSRIPRYTGCTRAGQFREFEKREKRVRLSELSVRTRNDFGKEERKKNYSNYRTFEMFKYRFDV